jgi:hypothetical protein
MVSCARTGAVLWTLARNIAWSSDLDSIALFRYLNATRRRELNQSPIALLAATPLQQLERPALQLGLRGGKDSISAPKIHTRETINDSVLRPQPVAFSADFDARIDSIPFLRARCTRMRLPQKIFHCSASDSYRGRGGYFSISSLHLLSPQREPIEL